MMDEAPVLIAGGGLTGLAAASFLAQQGIRSIAVERLKESSPLPRAAFFHMRTLEMFRELGIEARVREESAKEFVPDGALIAMDCISGRKLADIISNLNEGVDAVSPCRRWFLNQPSLEPILRERARAAGAEVLQGTEIIALRQDANGVTLRVRDVDGGDERELAGQYLIAADGGHSKVRELLGIGYEGRGAFSKSLTIYFSADLSPWIGEKPWSIIYVNNPVLAGFFRMNRAGARGLPRRQHLGDPHARSRGRRERRGRRQRGAHDRAGARRRRAAGPAGAHRRLLALARHRRRRARNSRTGACSSSATPRISCRRTAASVAIPGIHDAHNLAWKLAQVLQGHAHPRLLESYASERQPVARFTVEQAFARYVARTAPWLAAAQKTEPLAHDFDIEIGYLYGRDGVHADPRTTRGMPGSRLPHYWLERAGADACRAPWISPAIGCCSPGRTARAGRRPRARRRRILRAATASWRVGAELDDRRRRLLRERRHHAGRGRPGTARRLCCLARHASCAEDRAKICTGNENRSGWEQ